MEKDVKSSLEACLKCAAECNQCYDSCLKNNTGSDKKNCIATCRDCADICLFTASLISRNSNYAKDFVAICEKTCRQCADICKNSCKDNQACGVECKSCSDASLECAETCKDF